MHRKDRLIGLFLGVVVAVWGTAGAVWAKGPPASHTNHGHANGHASSHVVSHGSSTHKSSTQSSSSQQQTATTHSSSSTKTSPSSNGSSPPGNNGTVKIDNYSDRNGNDIAHNNEPHVTCLFGLDAYGYEAAAPVGNETFVQWAPTRGGSAQSGTLNNVHPRGTGATYNGSNPQSLSLSGTPHPKQGYHVKLTYMAADGNGNGSTLKHKVFWVQPCNTTPTTPGGKHHHGGPTSGAGSASLPAVAAAFFRNVRTARPAAAAAGTPGFTG